MFWNNITGFYSESLKHSCQCSVLKLLQNQNIIIKKTLPCLKIGAPQLVLDVGYTNIANKLKGYNKTLYMFRKLGLLEGRNVKCC